MDNHDPQEDDPSLNRIIKKAEEQADKNLEAFPRSLGFCHRLWGEKKRILKEEYGIDWRSPQDMNPEMKFD
ncbi:hypothetical protein ACFLUG_04360 [Chloroflexota bacterium]